MEEGEAPFGVVDYYGMDDTLAAIDAELGKVPK